MGWVETQRWVFGCVACVPMRAFSFDDTFGALLLIAFVVAVAGEREIKMFAIRFQMVSSLLLCVG